MPFHLPFSLRRVWLLVWLLLACACRLPAWAETAARLETWSVPVKGHPRTALVFQPSLPDDAAAVPQKMPVVLLFHGYGMNERQLMQLTRFNAVAAKAGFIAVYPHGEKRQWNGKAIPNHLTEDVDFTKALLARLKASPRVNARRIYAGGFSNGGFLVHRLACEMPGAFAAFATVSATMGRPLSEECRPTAQPASFLMIHGTADPIVTWAGEIHRLPFAFPGSRILSVPQTVNFWRSVNRCPDQDSALPIGTTERGMAAERRVFGPCLSGQSMAQIVVTGGGHTWPGAKEGGLVQRLYVGKTFQGMDATTEIARFFRL